MLPACGCRGLEGEAAARAPRARQGMLIGKGIRGGMGGPQLGVGRLGCGTQQAQPCRHGHGAAADWLDVGSLGEANRVLNGNGT